MKYVDDINSLDLNGTYSYADYLLWRFQERVELIKGKIFKMSPAPRSTHQIVSGELYLQFANFLKGNKCSVFYAPFDVRLPRNREKQETKLYNVVQPDLCVICDLSKIDERGCIGAPDLIIEILSPSSSKKDTQNKFELYQSSGVKEYWIVSTNDKLVMVFDLINGKYLLRKNYAGNDLVPCNTLEGLEIDLKEVFKSIEDY